MTYRVLWEDAALAELNSIWEAALDKEGIRNTATRINTELTYNPLAADESRDQHYRVLFKFPLVVWFEVLERLQEVRVLHVRGMKQ